AIQDGLGYHLPDSRTMLKAVSLTPAHNPNVFPRGMPIEDEVVVRRILILADARFQHWRILHPRKSICKIIAHLGNALRARHPLTCGGIKFWATRVVRNLEAAILV